MAVEIVNLTVVNGTRSSKEIVREWQCSNKDNCELYKKGECFHLNTFKGCIYGGRCDRKGYTTKSDRCGELTAEAKQSSKYRALTKPKENIIAKVGGYSLIDIEYLNLVPELKDSVVWSYFVEGDLTMEVAKLILDGKAISYSGDVIEQFEEEKKHFLRQLKTYNEEMYNKLIVEYPQYDFDVIC